MAITRKNHKKKHQHKSKTFRRNEYKSGDGMLTSVWGPSMWFYLHIMSFNYPINPTCEDKTNYRNFILNLQNTLPCKYCRENLKKNFKVHPLKYCHMKNRDSFSRYVYDLHEVINKMLGKKSNLTYCQVRDNYEHFRARCSIDKSKIFKFRKTKKEKGCTEPLYGKKAKCVIKIIPKSVPCKTIQIDKQCIKTRK